jgi:multiple sugar transport system substrate-binding protein
MIMLSRSQLIIIGSFLAIVVIFVLIFIFGSRGPLSSPQVELTAWGVFDDPSIFATIQYGKARINYVRKDERTYEQELIQALAAGKGPDIFMFHSTWLPKHIDKIVPFPQSVITLVELRNLFPQVVEQDFAPDGVIYALPLYIDTLALYWNKDYFDAKKVALPPRDWREFLALVPRLRELDSRGNIVRAAAAIGGSAKSVNRASDIISLLMLQNGTQMTDQNFGSATFGSGGGDKNPGKNALEFYTRFANPASPVYTWNDSLHYSLDSFAEGNAAMMFNYSYHISTLRSKNPYLNFGIAPVPQIGGGAKPITFANYWGLAVSKQSPNASAAWQYIKFITTNTELARAYMQKTKHPPALRVLIDEMQSDPDLGVFAQQALTARSWPQIDNNLVDRVFSDMIEGVVSGRMTIDKALKEAEDAISNAMRKR